MKDYNNAINLDTQLMNYASYAASEGKLPILKTLEDELEFQRKIAKKFNEFKRLVVLGECSIKDISDLVAKSYGPYFNVCSEQEITDELLNSMIEEVENPISSQPDPWTKLFGDIISQSLSKELNDDWNKEKSKIKNQEPTTTDDYSNDIVNSGSIGAVTTSELNDSASSVPFASSDLEVMLERIEDLELEIDFLKKQINKQK